MLVVCLDDNGLFASNRVKVVAAITNEIWPVTAEWLKDCHEGHSSLNIEAYKVNEVDSDDEDFWLGRALQLRAHHKSHGGIFYGRYIYIGPGASNASCNKDDLVNLIKLNGAECITASRLPKVDALKVLIVTNDVSKLGKAATQVLHASQATVMSFKDILNIIKYQDMNCNHISNELFPVSTSNQLATALSNQLVIAPSNELAIASSNELVVASSNELVVAPSNELVAASSNELVAAHSNELVAAPETSVATLLELKPTKLLYDGDREFLRVKLQKAFIQTSRVNITWDPLPAGDLVLLESSKKLYCEYHDQHGAKYIRAEVPSAAKAHEQLIGNGGVDAQIEWDMFNELHHSGQTRHRRAKLYFRSTAEIAVVLSKMFPDDYELAANEFFDVNGRFYEVPDTTIPAHGRYKLSDDMKVDDSHLTTRKESMHILDAVMKYGNDPYEASQQRW